MPTETAERIRELFEPAEDERRWYEQLRSLDPAEAVPLLAAILRDETETLLKRSQAVMMLAELRDQRGIRPLAEMLDTTDPVLRARVARALGRFERLDEAVAQRLIRGLQDQDYFVRESSAKALGELRHSGALAALEEMSMTDSVPANREVAQKAIEAITGTA